MDRKEMEVEDVSLEEEDFEGDNEEVMRMNPSYIRVEASPEPEE